MLKELTPEQIRDWSLEQKDRWWLENVYRGDAPQLNFRSAITGMILGGVLSLTNLYVGIKTGWTLGVGITSVILSFALFKVISHFKIGTEMTLLENNAMQSVATSAGYMTAPLISSIPAYMLVTGKVIPWEHTLLWMITLSILGVLYAFPLKKRFINDEQLPFPEGYASGVVLNSLHEESGKEGMFKAKLLGMGAGISSVLEILRNEAVMHAMKLKAFVLPEYWDDLIYKFATPTILGTPLKNLTVRWDTSIVMMGTGGLMNMKTAGSMILGATLNYVILAPLLIQEGVIAKAAFKEISMWALWGGVSMMTTASLFSFFSKPKIIIEAFAAPFRKKSSKVKKKDILKDIELPVSVSIVGIIVVGAFAVWMSKAFFGVDYWLGIVAIPLVFVFTLIAVNSTGLTGITPGGALGKLTQLTYSVLAPGNISTNIMAAGINGEVALNASNLLMDIKPGYMLGGKPRHQAIGHVLGIFAGGFVAVPVFYMLFQGDLSLLASDKLPMPAVNIWRAVAEVLTQGLSFLHPTAKVAVLVGAVLGILFEILGKLTQGRFPLSGVGMGLGFVLKFTDAWAMFSGSLLFWICERVYGKKKTSMGYRTMVANRETLAAGVIAGGSIIGIILIMLETFVLGH